MPVDHSFKAAQKNEYLCSNCVTFASSGVERSSGVLPACSRCRARCLVCVCACACACVCVCVRVWRVWRVCLSSKVAMGVSNPAFRLWTSVSQSKPKLLVLGQSCCFLETSDCEQRKNTETVTMQAARWPCCFFSLHHCDQCYLTIAPLVFCCCLCVRACVHSHHVCVFMNSVWVVVVLAVEEAAWTSASRRPPPRAC